MRVESKADGTSLPRSQSKNRGDAGQQSMLVRGSDNALIARLIRRIERIRQARSSLPSPFNPPGVYTRRITRVLRARERVVVTLIRYTQIMAMVAAGMRLYP